ncbi:MAG: magnesium/cobalt transporter CorA [Candidatus Aenigmarchaeota archaeon]|nr:magnesium/cobalt transporter CorA [Candidatus Aenigmarchaeota archaeon]
MPRFFKRVSKKAGSSPGALVHIGKKRMEKARITMIDYDEKRFTAKEVTRIEECFPFKKKPTVTWINIDGLHEVDIIEKIGKEFGIHPLVLEDVLNTTQRPKVEDFDEYIYIVLKRLSYDEDKDETRSEQMSIILGDNYVISFQESAGDVFDFIRKSTQENKGVIRKSGPDYLAYRLIDSIVDNYFLILEKYGDRIEGIEEDMVSNPKQETLETIHAMKKEMIFLRRSVWPLREAVSGLSRSESRLMKKKTHLYMRDVYDHTIQVIDTVETFRDMTSGLLDLYLSSISNKMNEVMKVLTIIATIFIPLSFFAGIYGMNFNPEASSFNMPELNHPLGYPAVLAFMTIVALIMISYFKRKKWM